MWVQVAADALASIMQAGKEPNAMVSAALDGIPGQEQMGVMSGSGLDSQLQRAGEEAQALREKLDALTADHEALLGDVQVTKGCSAM